MYKPSLVCGLNTLDLAFTKLYLIRSMLAYGSEAWVIRKVDEKRLLILEIKFMRISVHTHIYINKVNVL